MARGRPSNLEFAAILFLLAVALLLAMTFPGP
jgi:hypothetical protein